MPEQAPKVTLMKSIPPLPTPPNKHGHVCLVVTRYEVLTDFMPRLKNTPSFTGNI